MGRKAHSLDEILKKKVVVTSSCWLWTGPVLKGGYGKLKMLGKTSLAHRIFYVMFKGEIPPGLQLDHLCRVRRCVNPDHLEPVTPKVNTLRGEAPSAVNARRVICIHGHDLIGDNLYITPDGRRQCKSCRAKSSQKQNITIRNKVQ